MIKNFKELLKKVEEKDVKKMAVAVPEDKEVMKAIKIAVDNNIIEPILVGCQNKIEKIATELELNNQRLDIVDIENNKEACQEAVKLTSSGQADLLMKGLVDTSTLMKAVLNKEYGLRTNRLISHIAMVESNAVGRLLFVTDGGINIKPDLNERKEIIQNAINITIKLGYEKPKVAVLAAIEKVNSAMEETVTAAALAKMSDRGQIKNGIVDGPLAIDNALSEEAAKMKGIISPVAGKADILHVPEIIAGNILGKSSIYLAREKIAAIIGGTSCPIVVTSRSNTADIKLVSIVTAVLMV